MATQEELDANIEAKHEEQRNNRRQREQLKAIRNAEREALRQAESAGQRRRIKEEAEKAKGRVYDVGLDYTPPNNTEAIETATNDTFGNDEFTLAQEDNLSGKLPDGVEIIWQDQTVTFVPRGSIEQSYGGGYTSMVFEVVGTAFTRTIVYDNEEAIFEDDGATPPAQTKYRLRLQTLDGGNGVQLSAMGQYREVITVINGYPYVTLVKVS